MSMVVTNVVMEDVEQSLIVKTLLRVRTLNTSKITNDSELMAKTRSHDAHKRLHHKKYVIIVSNNK